MNCLARARHEASIYEASKEKFSFPIPPLLVILLSILSYLVPQIDGRSAHNSTKRVTLVNSVLPPRRAPFGGSTPQDHMVPLTKNLPPLNHDDGCLTEDQGPRKTGSGCRRVEATPINWLKLSVKGRTFRCGTRSPPDRGDSVCSGDRAETMR